MSRNIVVILVLFLLKHWPVNVYKEKEKLFSANLAERKYLLSEGPEKQTKSNAMNYNNLFCALKSMYELILIDWFCVDKNILNLSYKKT